MRNPKGGSRLRRTLSFHPTTAQAILGVLVLVAGLVVGSLTASPAHAATRYLEEIFPTVTETLNIPYGKAVNAKGQVQTLLADVYRPEGDSATDRPLVFWVHGGGFTSGDKSHVGDWARTFARRGYVAVSISYRLRPGYFFEFSNPDDPIAQGAVLDATHDGQAAVRWARANATELGIDPSKIAMGGISAGGVLSLGVGLVAPDTGASGTPGESSRICLAVSNAGAYTPQVVDEFDSPAVFLHGSDDDRVPVEYARIIESTMGAKGLDTEFHEYPGVGHVVPLSMALPTLLPILVEKLVEADCGPQRYSPGQGYTPATPLRLIDTRDSTGGPGGVFGGGEQRTYAVAGPGSISGGAVPAGATAVVVNVTSLFTSGSTHLTLWPSGLFPPTVSTLNLGPGQTVANLATVGLAPTGHLSIRNNSGTAHVIVDLVGWYGPGADGDRYVAVTPDRILDTRDGEDVGLVGAFTAAQTRTLDVVGQGGVPDGATAVAINLTAVGGTDDTHLTAWPSGTSMPLASTVNAAAGATVPNLAIVPLGADGGIQLFNNAGSVDVLGDVVGYFLPSTGDSEGAHTAVRPTRVFDTRDGITTTPGPFGPGSTRSFDATGQGGVPPEGAMAVVLNLTITQPSEATHLTVWPDGAPEPDASNLNVLAGQTRAVAVIVGLGEGDADGRVRIRNNAGSAHVVVDVVGWIGPGPAPV